MELDDEVELVMLTPELPVLGPAEVELLEVDPLLVLAVEPELLVLDAVDAVDVPLLPEDAVEAVPEVLLLCVPELVLAAEVLLLCVPVLPVLALVEPVLPLVELLPLPLPLHPAANMAEAATANILRMRFPSPGLV